MGFILFEKYVHSLGL